MCHIGKHTAGICIQDNKTCHVNFILCLLALFGLSLFFALVAFLFPPFGILDESSFQWPVWLFMESTVIIKIPF